MLLLHYKETVILFMEVTTDDSEHHTKHPNTMCRKNVKFYNFKTRVTYNNYCYVFDVCSQSPKCRHT